MSVAVPRSMHDATRRRTMAVPRDRLYKQDHPLLQAPSPGSHNVTSRPAPTGDEALTHPTRSASTQHLSKPTLLVAQTFKVRHHQAVQADATTSVSPRQQLLEAFNVVVVPDPQLRGADFIATNKPALAFQVR